MNKKILNLLLETIDDNSSLLEIFQNTERDSDGIVSEQIKENNSAIKKALETYENIFKQ